jgi:cytochrome c biogenesis protein CcmG, thiol:disulfide interchange protein DsbE
LASSPPDERLRSGAKRRIAAATLAAVLVLIAGAAAFALTRPNPRDTDGGRRPVAGIVLPGFGPAPKIDLASYRGRPVVINYWASWCTFCIAEMPAFQKAHERVGSTVAFIGVDVMDQQEAAKEFAKRTGVTYTLATDKDASIFKRLGGGLGMPTTFFVNRDGIIVSRFVGPLSLDELNKRLRKHFDV